MLPLLFAPRDAKGLAFGCSCCPLLLLAPNSKDPPAELPPNPAGAVLLLPAAPNPDPNPPKDCCGCCCAVPLGVPNVTPPATPEKRFGRLSPPPVLAPALAPPRPRFRGAILDHTYTHQYRRPAMIQKGRVKQWIREGERNEDERRKNAEAERVYGRLRGRRKEEKKKKNLLSLRKSSSVCHHGRISNVIRTTSGSISHAIR